MIGKILAGDLRRSGKLFLYAALAQFAAVFVLTAVFGIFDVAPAAKGMILAADGIVNILSCAAAVYALVYAVQTAAHPVRIRARIRPAASDGKTAVRASVRRRLYFSRLRGNDGFAPLFPPEIPPNGSAYVGMFPRFQRA